MKLLQLSKASLGFHRNLVLSGVDFEVVEREWHILHGSNGSGKSTFLRSILGAVPLLAGDRICHPQLKLGSLPQAQALDPVFPVSVWDVVCMGLWRNAKSLRKTDKGDFDFAHSCLERVGMEHRIHHRFSHLSGGQQQRVLLARAMASKPQLLVLDEPTTGMDEKSRARYYQSLVQMREEGTALVIATHEHEGWPDDSIHWVIGGEKLSLEEENVRP